MKSDRKWRQRSTYAALFAGTLLLGLASRRYAEALPRFVAAYAGDALWAAMVYWLGAVAWPALSRKRLAAAALLIAIAVEVSQLYRAAWIDAVRASRIGGLMLGRGFLGVIWLAMRWG